MFCVFGLLSFFPLPYTAFLGEFVLLKFTFLSLNSPAPFLIDSGM